MDLPAQKPYVTSYVQRCKRNPTNKFELGFEFVSVASLSVVTSSKMETE
jgi:hypothetical protein